MAFPPPTLPTTRTNTTVMTTTHPADHNAANQAINDIVTAVPRGLLAKANGPSTDTGMIYGSSPSQISGMLVSVTPVVGRWYRVRAHVVVAKDATSAFCYLDIRDGGSFRYKSTVISLPPNYQGGHDVEYTFKATAVTALPFYVNISCNSGSMAYLGAAGFAGWMTLEDLGTLAP